MRKRVGIIGAGQLGAYLCRAARDLDLQTTLLYESIEEVALELADNTIFLDPAHQEWLNEFITACDVITFEKEDVAIDTLEALQAAVDAGDVAVSPSVSIMRLLQNKAIQNQWLVDHDFPTVEFVVAEPETSFDELSKTLGLPFIMKAKTGGYDGLGVAIVESEQDMSALNNIPFIAERYVVDRCEIAVLVARNASGESIDYPCVEMLFDNQANILSHVVCPAEIPAELAQTARKIAKDIVVALDGVGLFAVEMFIEGDKIWVNEISPRVHNSGHLTLESQPTSQFEQHIRAVADLPLGEVAESSTGAMVNLLWDESFSKPPGQPSPLADDGVYVHWYGKRKSRHKRKMGHITTISKDRSQAILNADKSLEEVRGQYA